MTKLNRILQVIAVVCIVIVFSASALTLYSQRTLTAEDFPLEVDLNRSVFYVGENITFSASIINRSGRDANITSNGYQPAAWFYKINEKPILVEPSMAAFQYLKPDEQITRAYEFKTTEPGTYILYVHSQIGVNNVSFEHHHPITIEVR